jgi:hypothetical protein
MNISFEQEPICSFCVEKTGNIVRYDCLSKFWQEGYNLECKCKCTPDSDCDCHQGGDLHVKCHCCKICRFAFATRIDIPELEELATRGVFVTNHDSCFECKKYIGWCYKDKSGLTISDSTIVNLHKVVTEQLIHTKVRLCNRNCRRDCLRHFVSKEYLTNIRFLNHSFCPAFCTGGDSENDPCRVIECTYTYGCICEKCIAVLDLPRHKDCICAPYQLLGDSDRFCVVHA